MQNNERDEWLRRMDEWMSLNLKTAFEDDDAMIRVILAKLHWLLSNPHWLNQCFNFHELGATDGYQVSLMSLIVFPLKTSQFFLKLAITMDALKTF